MTLLVTLFLVLTNLFNEIPGTSPKVDGFSALTVWVLSCILFVFGALVGYAGILYRKMFAHKVIYLSFCLKNRSYCIIIKFSNVRATLFKLSSFLLFRRVQMLHSHQWKNARQNICQILMPCF